MPVYNDGYFEIYRIKQSNDVVVKTELEDLNQKLWFKELGITDKLRSTLNSSNVDIQMKIRTPYANKFIDSQCVLKIEGQLYKVYNVYHFTNSDGFKESDITLVNWSDDNDE